MFYLDAQLRNAVDGGSIVTLAPIQSTNVPLPSPFPLTFNPLADHAPAITMYGAYRASKNGALRLTRWAPSTRS